MPQDTIHHAGICNKGDDAHAAAAAAKQRIRFEDFLNQPSPRAPGFPGEIRIVLLGMYHSRGGGGLAVGGEHRNPGAVGIGSVKSLTMPPRVRNMRCNAMNPFKRIKLNGSRACPGVGGRFQNQASAVEFSQRIHGQYGARDVSGLRFQGGDFGGFHRRARKN